MVFVLVVAVVAFVVGLYVQSKFGILKASTVVKVDAAVKDGVAKVEEKVEGK